MSKSGRVSFSELRRAYRLVHECRDLGHDPAGWPLHALSGLARLTGGGVLLMADFAVGPPSAKPDAAVLGEWGWAGPRERAVWYERFVLAQEWRESCATFVRFTARLRGFQTCGRAQLVRDVEWYRSEEFNDGHRPAGIDDALWSFRIGGDPPRMFGMSLARRVGEPPFGLRERRLTHLFHDELYRHVGTALALESAGPFAGLPPRLVRTLRCLLEGDGEKQAALRLGVSRHTVHEYVVALYRHFGVQSRAELLALCLRRLPPLSP